MRTGKWNVFIHKHEFFNLPAIPLKIAEVKRLPEGLVRKLRREKAGDHLEASTNHALHLDEYQYQITSIGRVPETSSRNAYFH